VCAPSDLAGYLDMVALSPQTPDFNESVERNCHQHCACRGKRDGTGIREVEEESAQEIHSKSHALVLVVCVMLEFIICPVRIAGHSVNGDEGTRGSVQEHSSQK